MKKLGCLFSLILFFFIMSGCLHEDSISAKEVKLKKDELALKKLTAAYQAEEIDALAFVKEHNILTKRIKQEKEMLGNTHTHQH